MNSNHKLSFEFLKQIEEIKEKSNQPFFWESYKESVRKVKLFFHFLDKNIYKDLHLLFKQIEETCLFLQDYKEFINNVYNFKEKDYLFSVHSVNVSIISNQIGKILNINYEDCILLSNMGLVHDIGKITIDKHILYKRGLMTNKELSHFKNHTKSGFSILEKLEIDNKMILDVPLLHHEKLDGSGYPFSYKKEEIPFLIQIITVANELDRMCSNSFYNPKQSFFLAFRKLMEESQNKKINHRIVVPLIQTYMKFFVGKKVLLSNGLTGEIHKMNFDNPIKPIIKISENDLLDLSKEESIFIKEEQ